jgi:CheY-like chemotaxis protein
MILERAGYRIVAIDDPEEAVRMFKTSMVNAVVFGDSVNGDQRLQLARTFKSLNSAVPIVALSNTSGSQMAAGLVDQQLESLGDPHLLLEALKRVLARDRDGSAKTAPVHDHARTRKDGSGSVKSASSHNDGHAPNKILGSKTSNNSSF